MGETGSPGAVTPLTGRSRWLLAGLLLLALLLRLLYFTGLALGDDVLYATQAAALSRGGWPPEPYHWHTRLGVVVPAALAVKLLGLRPIAFVAWPLLLSTLGVLVCFLVARDLTDTRTAWLAALFQAVFPLELIYSTHLFPDVVVAVFSTLSIWYWLRGLRDDRARDYLLCGAFFAAGYLCRETVVMEGPIYLALWALSGRLRRPRLAWVCLVPLAALLAETTLFQLTAGSAFYRWRAILAQQGDPGNLELIRSASSGGGFFTDPLFLLFARQEFALYHAFALALAVYSLRRWPVLRPLVVWFVVGFFWTYYGTTVPTRWVTLQRDPRYAASLTVPSVIILAYGLLRLAPRVRWAAAALLVGSGLFGAALDQGKVIRHPHAVFLRSAYAPSAALEPFEYVAAKWELGLAAVPPFRCASDLGRPSVVRLLDRFGPAAFCPTSEARYLVLSPERRPGLLETMKAEGWTVAAVIPGKASPGRAAVGWLLGRVPSQKERGRRLLHPPGLVVLQNPQASVPARDGTGRE